MRKEFKRAVSLTLRSIFTVPKTSLTKPTRELHFLSKSSNACFPANVISFPYTITDGKEYFGTLLQRRDKVGTAVIKRYTILMPSLAILNKILKSFIEQRLVKRSKLRQ